MMKTSQIVLEKRGICMLVVKEMKLYAKIVSEEIGQGFSSVV